MRWIRAWLVMTCVSVCLSGCTPGDRDPVPTRVASWAATASADTRTRVVQPAGTSAGAVQTGAVRIAQTAAVGVQTAVMTGREVVETRIMGTSGTTATPRPPTVEASRGIPVVTNTPAPLTEQGSGSYLERTAAYSQLPEITVALDCWLAPAPSHPSRQIPGSALRAGDRLRLVGTNQDGAWLLVAHGSVLGWLPNFYSRTPTGTFKSAVVSYSLVDACTAYLGAVQSPSEVWSSPIRGAVIVQGLVFHSQAAGGKRGVAVEIESTGTTVQATLAPTALTGTGQVLSFTAEVANLQRDSRVRFRLSGFGDDPLTFQANFFTRGCAQDSGTAGLPGAGTTQPRAITPGPSPTPVVIVVERGPAAGSGPCRPAFPTRLSGGGNAHVSVSAELNVRNRPGANDGIPLGRLQPGATVKIVGGPTCVDNMLWWRVEGAAGLTGWASEGGADGYYLAPGATPPASPPSPPGEAPPPASVASNRGALTQGQNGWIYQYEQGRNSGNFAALSNRQLYNGIDCFISPREGYVRLCADGELHPGQEGRIAYRWDSSYNGPVTLQIHAHKVDAGGGDGIWIGTYVGETGRPPQKVGEFEIAGWDNNGSTRSYHSQLSTNSYVLVIIDIRGQPEHDQSRVYIDVLRR